MTTPYNYTIRGRTDGFGSQYNAILSGLAFCEHSPDYNYVHTPLRDVSHGWRDKQKVAELNEFIGIPDGREDKEIHKSETRNKTLGLDSQPSNWYDDKTLEKIRNYYWSSAKPRPCKQDIVVHMRRGDINVSDRLKKDGRSAHSGASKRRYTGNEWYRDRIPWIAAKYPKCYTIAIHSEGDANVKDPMYEFNSVMDGWPQSLKDRTTWKIAIDCIADQEHSLKVALHEMVTAKVFLMGRSSLSYVAALLSEGDVFYQGSGQNNGYPLDHWRVIQHSSSKYEDGITYKEIINLIKKGKD